MTRMSFEETARTDVSRGKSLKSARWLIEHMKAMGITFDLIEENDASEALRCNNYLRVSAYRNLYPRQVDGPNPGNYIGLDFADLVVLAKIDRRLREALLLAAIDVEHSAKVKVLNIAEEKGEDGHAIVRDFYESLNHEQRARIKSGLRARGDRGEGHDCYTGDLIAHYGVDSLPLWVLVEVLEFGPFLTLYKFCAERWNNERLRQEHYVLKSVKALRNACAHNSCIVNGFKDDAEQAGYATNGLILESMNERGLSNTKTRRSKMKNLRIMQIASLLYAISVFCETTAARKRCAERLSALRCFVESTALLERSNDGIVSFFKFLWRLVDIWVPECS